ncbi:small-conductance mechanosensitive channel [Rhizobium sp. BK275]|uniref:mechanosensitive ion channel family protein n=1 Tax=Rhizobium sp. BK275 TaxID=2587077 RepID=UPI00160C1962|nr:mechanosensitive ion channel family protein [Rhizobium sp. BK275]MBB3390555.1 small-conductance mechanosensitive channel [Rhizobium sp. BK275]
MIRLGVFLLAFLVATAAAAQTAPPPPQQKIDQLIGLLQDPEIQTWLESRKKEQDATAAAAQPSGFATWEARVRSRIHGILAAVPRIPSEVSEGAARARQDAVSHGYAPIFLIFAGLVAAGAAAEWLFRRARSPSIGPVARLLPVAVFTLVVAIIFFAVEWPPLARLVLLAYLAAFVVYRVAAVLIGLVESIRPSLAIRAQLFVGIALFAAATATLGAPLGVDQAVTEAISYCFSLLLLALAIETVWSALARSIVIKTGLTAFLALLWILWCLDLQGLFWLGVYALVLPDLLRAIGGAAAALTTAPSGSARSILLVRGSRAIIIALAVGWLALVWRLSPDSLANQNTTLAAVLHGLLKGIIVLLIADLLWQLAKGWIDRSITTSADATGLAPAEVAKRARFRTLLPIFRNALAVMVAVMAGLIVLAQLGVEIGPLIAGAGIFGVAIGFGSQTLVKDVISGVFYMLDDAFRVGEYIQAKNYKGTVEGFSLRSVRLRHHRGPVFTVPFGELGAVENMSRDWVIDKFRISVAYNTDINKARKITKTIGAELKEDAEVGPLFIEPLKMKGVEEFGDYGIVLSFAMTTVPGMQTYIRRKAYAMIREAFQNNGIEFAQPMVQVGGDDKNGAAAAATATLRAAQQAKAAGTEG